MECWLYFLLAWFHCPHKNLCMLLMWRAGGSSRLWSSLSTRLKFKKLIKCLLQPYFVLDSCIDKVVSETRKKPIFILLERARITQTSAWVPIPNKACKVSVLCKTYRQDAWAGKGNMTLMTLREVCKKSKWKFKMAFAIRGPTPPPP